MVCVSELAVWISSGLAIVGRIAERPAVKKGEFLERAEVFRRFGSARSQDLRANDIVKPAH